MKYLHFAIFEPRLESLEIQYSLVRKSLIKSPGNKFPMPGDTYEFHYEKKGYVQSI